MGDFVISGVHKTFTTGAGEVVALQDINLRVEDQEFVAIVGASGSGKSTLLNLVAGFDTPSRGDVLMNGAPVTGPGPDRGVVFQQSALYPWLTVRGNVAFGLGLARNRHRFGGTAERDAIVDGLVRRVGLEAFKHSLPAELSGGMRQRAAIASVLAINPEVLLMDEPFGALDEQTRLLLGDKVLQIHQELKQTTLLITHSITEAVQLSDRIVVMSYRPGRVKRIVTVDLPRPRSSEMLASEAFTKAVAEIWADLREEASRGMRESEGK